MFLLAAAAHALQPTPDATLPLDPTGSPADGIPDVVVLTREELVLWHGAAGAAPSNTFAYPTGEPTSGTFRGALPLFATLRRR